MLKVIITFVVLVALGMALFVLCLSPPNTYIYTLGVMATIKNEEMVISEWIEHYVWQGAEHFYIIDNGSTDGTREVLDPYIKKGLVTYYFMPEKYKQTENYNTVYNERARSECKWLMAIDADEYVYNRQQGNTISTYLNNLDYDKFKSVCLYWKLFGSSGYDHQPKSIRESFVWRKPQLDNTTKHIVNTRYAKTLNIHSTNDDNSEKAFPSELALNHYPIMSKEYYGTIKMTRGDSELVQSENVRDWEYFRGRDADTDTLDEELADLVRSISSRKKE